MGEALSSKSAGSGGFLYNSSYFHFLLCSVLLHMIIDGIHAERSLMHPVFQLCTRVRFVMNTVLMIIQKKFGYPIFGALSIYLGVIPILLNNLIIRRLVNWAFSGSPILVH